LRYRYLLFACFLVPVKSVIEKSWSCRCIAQELD
jgi:hypothetical protein